MHTAFTRAKEASAWRRKWQLDAVRKFAGSCVRRNACRQCSIMAYSRSECGSRRRCSGHPFGACGWRPRACKQAPYKGLKDLRFQLNWDLHLDDLKRFLNFLLTIFSASGEPYKPRYAGAAMRAIDLGCVPSTTSIGSHQHPHRLNNGVTAHLFRPLFAQLANMLGVMP